MTPSDYCEMDHQKTACSVCRAIYAAETRGRKQMLVDVWGWLRNEEKMPRVAAYLLVRFVEWSANLEKA